MSEEAGEYEGSGYIAGVAEEVVVDAAKVSAKADVVLLVDPRGGICSSDCLVGLKVRLLLVHAGELVERQVGQAIEQWVSG